MNKNKQEKRDLERNMNMNLTSDLKLKSCPFCGSTKLDFSSKRVETYDYTNYRTCVYCKNCNSYGPRVLVKHVEPNEPYYLQTIDTDGYEEAKAKAIEAWNNRK